MTTCDTSRAHQSKEGTRSRSNAASAQVNNEASYANVRSDVMQAAYEAGLAGAKVYRLKKTRNGLRQHHPDLDLRGLAPEVLFKNMSPADIDALDEATFQATIDEWKRANNIPVPNPRKKKPRLQAGPGPVPPGGDARKETGENTGRWSDEEHTRFLHGLELFGRKYTKIAGHVGTRTTVQVRSHAHKYFKKLAKVRPAPADPTAPAPAAAPKPKGSKKRKAAIAALDVDASSARAAAPAAPVLDDDFDEAAPLFAPEPEADVQDTPVAPLLVAAAPVGAVAVSPFDMGPFSGALQPLDVVEVAASRDASALEGALAARAWETPPLPPPLDDCALACVLADLDAQSRQAAAAPAPVAAAPAAPAAPAADDAAWARKRPIALERLDALAAVVEGHADAAVEAKIRELRALLER